MDKAQLLEQPALAPPPGVEPILDNPPNDNTLVHGVTAVCLLATTAAFLVRSYSRLVVLRQVRVEDGKSLTRFLSTLIFAGYGVYIGYIYCIYRVIHGLGFFVHQWNVRIKYIAEFSYVIFIGSCFYGIVIACVKAAILLEWARIFVPAPTRNTFFYSCWALLIFNSLYYLAATITQNVACTPYKYTWDKTIPGGHCVNVPAVNVVSACINLVSDFAIIILPQQVIWRLQMSVRKKIGVSLIFAVGIFGCVAAIFRLVVTLDYEKADDVTYTVSPVALWALGEMTSVFLVACVPSAPKAFTGQGILTKAATRFASWTGLSSRKNSSEHLAGPRAPKGPPSSNRYKKIHGKDSVLLATILQHQTSMRAPQVTRTVDVQHEDMNDCDIDHSLVIRQHPWVQEQPV
ncbi:hypothetical protein F4780DRAFT_768371 [Xylariomycetidae sp. FL0641]|nr:hypothetical protein F4780DRAFT_768371 [Xylariomycetidae sp. FL0641]